MLVAEFRLRSSVLHETLEALPNRSISCEQQYIDNDGGVRMLFWVEGVSGIDFEDAVGHDSTVTNLSQLCKLEMQTLYRGDLTDDGQSVSTMSSWPGDDIVPFDVTATHDGWLLRLGVPGRKTVLDYRERYEDYGCSFTLHALYDRTEAASAAEASLTEPQRTALIRALETGFFAIPRKISQDDLTIQLGISTQSVSERLRRGVSTLIEAALSWK